MGIVSTTAGTLDKHILKEWCLKYHYAKRVPVISFGFGYENSKGELQAVLAVGKPASNPLCKGVCGEENSQYVYELQRICAKDDLEIPLSQFVGEVLRLLPNLVLVSYADTAWNHVGYIYQATNWLYTGATKPRTDIASKGHSRHYEKAEEYLERVERSSKHRYVTFTGDKKFRKALRKCLKYKVLPYPKGKLKKYDINWDV